MLVVPDHAEVSNVQVYLTYKPLNGDVARYLEDTHTLVYKHTARASSIDEQVIQFNPGVSGVIYSLGGEAASATQFFVTDSVHHFLRGAVYFNVAPNADSLAPVQDYIPRRHRKDAQDAGVEVMEFRSFEVAKLQVADRSAIALQCGMRSL